MSCAFKNIEAEAKTSVLSGFKFLLFMLTIYIITMNILMGKSMESNLFKRPQAFLSFILILANQNGWTSIIKVMYSKTSQAYSSFEM